jgi:hypothetical protein
VKSPQLQGPVERWIVVAGIVLAAGGIMSTLLISRPIHAQLDIQGNTPELVSRVSWPLTGSKNVLE